MAEAKKTAKKKKLEVTEEVKEVIETPEATTEVSEQADQPTVEPKIAKAGKRSSKALEEAEEKQAKEERKAQATETDGETKPKQAAKPTRPRIERQGKKFREAAKLVEKDKTYSLAQAVELAQKTSPTKFDATVEMHVNLNVDPRHADQNIRDNLVLPAGTGKNVRVAVFADADDATAAKKAGADVAGTEELLKELDKGIMNFDVLIATPSQMSKLGKYARALGPRGLMPNPKSGTVTTDVTKAVTEAKAGRVEYRVDSSGIVHLGIGKVSFTKDKLLENAQAVAASIKSNKPSSVKGGYVKAVYFSSTMGPSISVAPSEL